MGTDRIDTEALPFSKDKQVAVLGHVLKDERFFATVINKLELTWFADPLCGKLFGASKSWWKRWGRMPSINELLDSEYVSILDPQSINQIRALAAMSMKSRETYSPGPLLHEMEIWIKARSLQIGLPKAAQLYNNQQFDEAAKSLNGVIRDYHDIHFTDTGEASFDNYREEILRSRNDAQQGLTFGLEAVDRLLAPNSNGGCLLPGHMTVILAPSNAGKSSCMITIVVANIMRGKSVLLVTHEGTESEIKGKVLRCLTNMNDPELERAYLDPAQAERMDAYESILRRFLTFLPINRPGLTVEEVTLTIEKFQENRRLATGKGYDMLADDYPAKLLTEVGSKGNLQLRNIQEIVYNSFVQMGIRNKFHVLTAVQTNREGSKLNRRSGQFKNETSLLQLEAVSESWGVMTAAATVISVNRTDEEAMSGFLTYLVCKSRSSATGWAITCKTDYDRCRTHSNDMGCFTYRGTQSLGSKSADIFQGFKGKMVPPEKIKYFETVGS